MSINIHFLKIHTTLQDKGHKSNQHGKWAFTKSTYTVHLVLSSSKNTMIILQNIKRTFLVSHRQYSVGSDGNQFKVHIVYS